MLEETKRVEKPQCLQVARIAVLKHAFGEQQLDPEVERAAVVQTRFAKSFQPSSLVRFGDDRGYPA